MSALVLVLVRARKAGLTIDRDGTRLTVRGDRQHAALVGEILRRKAETLTLVDLYNGRATALDWRHATVAERAEPCRICRRRAHVRDPFDGVPMHKTCAEQTLSGGGA